MTEKHPLLDLIEGMPRAPVPPLYMPVENKDWFRFVVFGDDGITSKKIDDVMIHKPTRRVVSTMYGPLDNDPDKREMALDWMAQLKRNPFVRAVADRTMLH